MLEIEELTARFGPVEAVRAVSLSVDAGELVAVIGPNGAGKTTLLRAVMGQHPDRGGVVRVNGTTVQRGAPTTAARAGLAIVPQGRRLFPSLTVGEHLDLSSHRGGRSPRLGRADLLDFFPGLGRRLDVRAGMLSGGEQQMLAIGRATLLDPSFVLMDEPTEGLSPAIVDNVAALVAHLPALGIGVLLADQAESPLIPHARVVHMDRGSVGGAALLGGNT